MDIKKNTKIILINIFLSIAFLLMLEAFCVYKEYKTVESSDYKLGTHLKYLFKSYKNFSYINTSEIRPISYPEHIDGKSPLAIMGCSFAYGLGLSKNETLADQLAKKTNRIVYNLGVTGSSPREMLYILRNDKLRNELFGNRNDFEYIIQLF